MSAPKLFPAVLGGLFLGVLSSLPIVGAANLCCCLWILSGGALAAWLMQQNYAPPITLGDGAVVGLLAGAFGFVVMTLVSIPVSIMTGAFQGMSDGLMNQPGMTPEMRELLARVDPAFIMVATGVVMLTASLVFSTIGGLVGAALFGKKAPPPVPPVAPGGAPPPVWPPLPEPPAVPVPSERVPPIPGEGLPPRDEGGAPGVEPSRPDEGAARPKPEPPE